MRKLHFFFSYILERKNVYRLNSKVFILPFGSFGEKQLFRNVGIDTIDVDLTTFFVFIGINWIKVVILYKKLESKFKLFY